jgi:large subunit ribosomal protein L15
MKLKKRKKFGRARGTRLCGWAAKKHKGSGNRGGKGMSGSGKRGDQRKSFVIKYLFPYFGKRGFTSRPTAKKISNVMNIHELARYKEGEVRLEKYKILGQGELKGKYIVKAKSFSKKAREKIEKAGGQAITTGKEKKLKE